MLVLRCGLDVVFYFSLSRTLDQTAEPQYAALYFLGIGKLLSPVWIKCCGK